MGERTTRFCDSCEKTIGRGFQVVGSIIPLGSDDEDDNQTGMVLLRHLPLAQTLVIKEGDYCPTCLGKKLGMAPDILSEIMSGLDEVMSPKPCASEENKPTLVDMIGGMLDDLCEMVEPSEGTKQRVKDLGAKIQTNWSVLSAELQTHLKKAFNVDESDPDETKITPKTNSNGSAE